MRKMFLWFFVVFIILTGCSNTKAEEESKESLNAPYKADSMLVDKSVIEGLLKDEEPQVEEEVEVEGVIEEVESEAVIFDYTNVSFLPKAPSEFIYLVDSTKASFKYSQTNDIDKFDKEVLVEYDQQDYADDHYYYLEDEEGLYETIGMSYSKSLAYPIKVNTSWTDFDEYLTYTIEEINVKVDTPYKTFDNAVKVSHNDGYAFYYAPGYGMIKVTNNGIVISELIDVK